MNTQTQNNEWKTRWASVLTPWISKNANTLLSLDVEAALRRAIADENPETAIAMGFGRLIGGGK